MDIKIKTKLAENSEIEGFVKKIQEIAEEYSCNCTLLEIEID